MAQSKDDHATLAVLAGGFGSRMGIGKAALTVGGKPILSYLLDRLNWSGTTLLVTAPGREKPPGAEHFDGEAVDAVEGEGPLRGILTALANARDNILVVTVDMPGVTPAMLHSLLDAAKAHPELHGVMFRTPTDVETFPSFFRASARVAIEKALSTGRRSVRRLLQDPGFATIAAPIDWPASVWTNLNTPEDLRAFEKSLAAGHKIRTHEGSHHARHHPYPPESD